MGNEGVFSDFNHWLLLVSPTCYLPLREWMCFRAPSGSGQQARAKPKPYFTPGPTTLGLTALVESRAPEAGVSRLPLPLLPRWGEEEGESSM